MENQITTAAYLFLKAVDFFFKCCLLQNLEMLSAIFGYVVCCKTWKSCPLQILEMKSSLLQILEMLSSAKFGNAVIFKI